MVWPSRAFQPDTESEPLALTSKEDDMSPSDYDPRVRDQNEQQRAGEQAQQQDVPKDAVDAQSKAFIEEAEDEAKLAAKEAEHAKFRAEEYERKKAEQTKEAKGSERDERPRDAFGNVIVQPGDVVSVSGPRNVPMETTEDDRLVRHKAMVRDHLRNADPDMTGGVGEEEPELDPETGLPKGHVPEGHQDGVMLGGRDPQDPVIRR